MSNIWKTMESAPKDRPILAYCVHAKNDYFIPGSAKLTIYGAHCECWAFAKDGVHIVEFGGEYEDTEDGYLPPWWFVNGSGFEVVVNPIYWCDIPDYSDIEND